MKKENPNLKRLCVKEIAFWFAYIPCTAAIPHFHGILPSYEKPFEGFSQSAVTELWTVYPACAQCADNYSMHGNSI